MMCSICAGTKTLETGKPCGCKDGTIYGELAFLREVAFTYLTTIRKLQRALVGFAEFAADWKKNTGDNSLLEMLPEEFRE